MFTKHKVRPGTEGKLDELSLKTWPVPGGSRDDQFRCKTEYVDAIVPSECRWPCHGWHSPHF